MKVRELVVKLGVDADEDALDGFDEAMGRVLDTGKRLATALAGTAAAYAAVGGAATKAATNLLEYSEEVVRNSQAMGLATDKYQQFRFAFKNLNASTDDMMDAFSTLTDRAVDAVEGAENYRREFERIGVSMDELRGKDPGQIFDTYMQKMQQVGETQESVTANVRLLGDDLGRRIMPAMTSSVESFKTLTERAERAGVIIDPEELERARKLRMQFRELKGRLSAIWRVIGLRVLPVFSSFMRQFDRFLAARQETEDLFEAVEDLMLIWGEDIQFVINQFKALGEFFSSRMGGSWSDHVQSLIVLVKGLGAALIGALGASFVASIVAFFSWLPAAVAVVAAKAVAIGAAIAVVGAVIQDIVGYLQGSNSLIGTIMDNFGGGMGMLDQIARTAEDFSKLWSNKIAPTVSTVTSILFPTLLAQFSAMVSAAWAASKGIIKVILAVFRAFVNWTRAYIDLLVGVWDALVALFQGEFKKAGRILLKAIGRFALDVMNILWRLFKDLFRAVAGFFVDILMSALEQIAGLIEKIPGPFGDDMVDQVERFQEKMSAPLEPNYGKADTDQANREVGRRAVAQDSSLMFGPAAMERPAAAPQGGKTKVREGDQVVVENNLTVEGELSSESQARAKDIQEEANRSAVETFKGGKE